MVYRLRKQYKETRILFLNDVINIKKYNSIDKHHLFPN